MEGDGPFDWNVVVPRVVHPLQVAVVEAIGWIDAPLSASDLTEVFMGRFPLEEISYHVRRLAYLEALTLVEERTHRGWLRKWYFLSGRDWEPGSAPYDQAA